MRPCCIRFRCHTCGFQTYDPVEGSCPTCGSTEAGHRYFTPECTCMEDLNRYPDRELKAELERRRKERKLAWSKETEAWNDRLRDFLRSSPEILDFFEHECASCPDDPADDGTPNAHVRRGHTHADCARCALQEFVRDGWFDECKIRLEVSFDWYAGE